MLSWIHKLERWLKFKCLCYNKNYQKFHENLKKFANTYEPAKQDIIKFILLLKKGVYPYEWIDDWYKFNGIEKEDFYSDLNMKDKWCRL